MGFGITFILVMLGLGGFAAYQGDKVGRAVGRRRLTIFGLRPKYTSRIITVLTGFLIVLITLGSSLVLSNNVRQALFGMDQLRESVAVLSEQVSESNRELARVEAEHARLDRENRRLQEENDAQRAENRRLAEEQKELEERLQIMRLLGAMYEDFSRFLSQANLAYHTDQVIDAHAIDVRRPPWEVAESVRRALTETDAKVLEEGGGDPVSGRGIRFERPGVLSEEEMVGILVDAMLSDPDVESVILQVVALGNTPPGVPVPVDFNLWKNVLVYPAGSEVARRTFVPRAGLGGIEEEEARLFEELYAWLSSDVHAAARAAGVLEQPRGGSIGEFAIRHAFGVVRQISAQPGPVELIALAGDDIWANDVLTLEFVVQPARPGGPDE